MNKSRNIICTNQFLSHRSWWNYHHIVIAAGLLQWNVTKLFTWSQVISQRETNPTHNSQHQNILAPDNQPETHQKTSLKPTRKPAWNPPDNQPGTHQTTSLEPTREPAWNQPENQPETNQTIFFLIPQSFLQCQFLSVFFFFFFLTWYFSLPRHTDFSWFSAPIYFWNNMKSW